MKKDWEIKKLYEVCEIECGTRVVRKVDGGTIYPVYGGGGATFKMDTYNREDCLIVSRFAMSEKCTRFVEGKFFLNDSGLSLKANENVIYQKYLETVILGKNDEIYSLGRGAAQKNLDMARFRELEISYPKSLEEQKLIVKILDEKFAQLESLKANAQTNLQNAKDLFQSQLTKAFSNTSWEKKRLGDICTKIVDGTHNSPPNTSKGEYQYITAKNIKKTGIDLSDITYVTKEIHDSIYARCNPEKGDVLLIKDGATTGIAVVNEFDYEFSLLSSVALLKFDRNILDSYCLAYLLNSEETYNRFRAKMEGAAITRLTLVKIKDFEIPLPPLPEQKRIVKELDTLSEKVRQLQKIYTKQIANCEELKQSLLQKAFEGEL